MRVTEKFVFFWGNKEYASNFYSPAKFEYLYNTFQNSEQCFMYLKAVHFKDFETAEKILVEKRPAKVKALGRTVKGFNAEEWSKVSQEYMWAACYSKFSQNADLKEWLLNTGDRILVEASPIDNIWGIGLSENDGDVMYPEKWKGENRLGEVLMKVRAMLRNQNEESITK